MNIVFLEKLSLGNDIDLSMFDDMVVVQEKEQKKYKFRLIDFLEDGEYINHYLIENKKMFNYIFSNDPRIVKYINFFNLEKAKMLVENLVNELEKYQIKDIVDYYEAIQAKINQEFYKDKNREEYVAGSDFLKTKEKMKESPEYGASFQSPYLNTIFRGIYGFICEWLCTEKLPYTGTCKGGVGKAAEEC